jgi:hypothetical protein
MNRHGVDNVRLEPMVDLIRAFRIN